MANKTVDQAWSAYRARLPQEMAHDQEDQLRIAFHVGALTALEMAFYALDLSGEDAAKVMRKLFSENEMKIEFIGKTNGKNNC